jgi:peptide/nickel transport system permease protein
MGGFLLRKVGAALIVLLLASLLVFAGVRAIPGDPAIALGAENRDPAVLSAIRHKYGLDRPVPVQYVNWLGLAVRGDLGTDQRQLSVSRTIVQRLPITLELAFLAIVIGTVIGVGAGILAAVRHGKPSDYASTTVALVGLSVPHFWLGIVMIIYFAVTLHWLPAGGYIPFGHDPVQNLEHMLMPAIVLGTGLSAVLMRQMRSSMLASLGADYVRTARAKGLLERRVVMRHAFRNALIPLVTVIAIDFGALFAGAIVTETIFTLDGMGYYFINSLFASDPYPVMAWLMVVATMVILFNLIADILYGVFDPRIRYD